MRYFTCGALFLAAFLLAACGGKDESDDGGGTDAPALVALEGEGWYGEPPEGQLPPLTQKSTATFATAFCASMVILLGVLPGPFLSGIFRLS